MSSTEKRSAGATGSYRAAAPASQVCPLQVSAHGTGAGLPPVDEQVVALTLVTPGQGILRLSLQVLYRHWPSFQPSGTNSTAAVCLAGLPCSSRG